MLSRRSTPRTLMVSGRRAATAGIGIGIGIVFGAGTGTGTSEGVRGRWRVPALQRFWVPLVQRPLLLLRRVRRWICALALARVLPLVFVAHARVQRRLLRRGCGF